MDRNTFFKYLRYLFIGLNGLIIIAGVVCFILGNINFAEKFYYSGSFIGGQLASISLLFIVYGFLGIYAAVRNDRIAIMIYASIALVSLITRLLLWCLAAMHSYKLLGWNYAYIALELTIILISGLVYYFNKWIINWYQQFFGVSKENINLFLSKIFVFHLNHL